MVTQEVIDALNAQIKMEANASQTYLAMASWCEQSKLEACAEFFYRQSEEERVHMLKLFKYVNEIDGHAISPSLDEPKRDYGSVKNLFASFLAQEKEVTKAINNIVLLTQQVSDLGSYSFLQWYVVEQREEEMVARNILDKIELIGDGPQSLYFIDKELESINAKNEGSL